MEDNELGISVVITTYNEGKYLTDLLDSLIGQQPPFQVVIVDSESTDNTRKVLKSYTDTYDNIKLVERKCSRGEGRNIGVTEADYDYVAFTDGDAIANAFWIEKMRRNFQKGYGVVAGKTIQMGYEPFEKLARVELYFENFEVTSPSVNLGYKKRLFQDIGGFDTDFVTAEDIDLNIRAVMTGEKIGICNDCLIYHRARSTFVGFIEQAFWNGFGRKQLTNKHREVWSHFKASDIFKPEVINFWYLVRGFAALIGYLTCKIFGDEFLKRKSNN